jgi:hypothetical protein
MATTAQYRAEVVVKWIYNNKETEIESANISYILFDYDFDDSNMPIAYMSINLKTSLYNSMVEHVNEAKIYLDIERYNINEDNPVHSVDVKEQFQYYLPSDETYNQDLEEAATESNNEETSFVHVIMGLLHADVYDENKRAFSDMVYTGNLSTLVYLGLDKVKRLCINEPTKNVNIKNEDIPPTTSINEYLSYIDSNWEIYTYGYRYFHDFRTTYMLDEDPRYVSNGSSQYKDVIINILDDGDEKVAAGGIVIDKDNSTYTLNIGSSATTFSVDKGTESAVTEQINVDDSGNTTSSAIVSSKKATTKKVTYSRNTDSKKRNSFEIHKYKTVLDISRPQLDGHLFTPNKIYNVVGYKEKSKNGQYVLWRRRTTYQQEDSHMIPTTNLTLRKLVI